MTRRTEPLLLAAAGAVGAAVLLTTARLPGMLAAVSWNADALAPGLIAERGGRGPTVLGDISSAGTLWLDLSTRWLPGHRTLWTLVAPATALGGAALLGWAAARLARPLAAGIGAGLALAVGPDAMLTLLAPAFRGPTWSCGALLAALLVALAVRTAGSARERVVLAAGAGVVAGVGVASDPLLGASALVPFAGAVAWVWARDRSGAARALLAPAAVLVAVTAATALAATAALRAADLGTRRALSGAGYLDLAGAREVGEHALLLGKGVLALAGAPGMGGFAEGWEPLRWTFAALALGGLALALPPSPPAGRASIGRRLYLRFWALSAACVAGAYLLSGIPADEPAPSAPGHRYLVPLLLAAIAVLPLLLADGSARRRAGAAAASIGLAATGLLGVALGDLERAQRPPIAAQAQRMADWLAGAGVERGYASYWNAAPLAYHTGLDVAAVRACGHDGRRTLCPAGVNARRGWYDPRPGPSFIVLDATVPSDAWITGGEWQRSFPRPIARRTFGRIHVHVYRDDLARRLAPRWPGAEPSASDEAAYDAARRARPRA